MRTNKDLGSERKLVRIHAALLLLHSTVSVTAVIREEANRRYQAAEAEGRQAQQSILAD